MSDLLPAVGNFGFPIVVSLFLLIRFENKLEKLTDAMQRNTDATKELVNAVNSLKKR